MVKRSLATFTPTAGESKNEDHMRRKGEVPGGTASFLFPLPLRRGSFP